MESSHRNVDERFLTLWQEFIVFAQAPTESATSPRSPRPPIVSAPPEIRVVDLGVRPLPKSIDRHQRPIAENLAPDKYRQPQSQLIVVTTLVESGVF